MAEYHPDEDEEKDLSLRLRSAENPDAVFREVFNRYHRRLLGFFKSRGFDIEACHELSQETFLRIYRGRVDFRAEVPLAAWIFQIADRVSKNEALEQLPPKMRRVVQMSILQQRSVAQIAVMLKISKSTVKAHLHQARNRIREALADRFGELHF